MKQVISCSRRTDVPAFYLPWLIKCIKRGYAEVLNWHNNRWYKVSLRPEDVHTVVLWSKNFRPFLAHRLHFNDYHLFYNFTLNSCPRLEPKLPPLQERLAQMRELIELYGIERVQWRFDPIVLWDIGRKSNLDGFELLAEEVSRLGITRCYFSFATWYPKVGARLQRMGFPFYHPSLEERCEIAGNLADIAGNHGITLFACCNDELVGVNGINKAHCIDGGVLSLLAGESCALKKDEGQRPDCGCTKSRDIGSYNNMPCYHACLYCYANPAPFKANLKKSNSSKQ